MVKVYNFQIEKLKDSWQLDVVCRTIKHLTEQYDWIIVHKDYIEFKNKLLSLSNDKNLYRNIREWDKVFNKDTKALIVEDREILDSVNKNLEKVCAIFTNPYMYLFNNEIMRLDYNRENVRRVIRATFELYEQVIKKELGIEDIAKEKKSILNRILSIFKVD